MQRIFSRFIQHAIVVLGCLTADSALAQTPTTGTSQLSSARDVLKELVSDAQTANDLRRIQTPEEWTQRRPDLVKELQRMLGLDPFPERTPLLPVITGTIQQPDVLVERVQFQSLPGLYVTGNLYRPTQVDKPLPAVLYVCGHAQVVEDGVSLGNKTFYQHHGIWFATHGYVCLVIDTIQLGEIQGIHHGTHRMNRWDWPAKGYTPAGVEAWNSIRAIDYLVSRKEVDSSRIGITGRSGGGAYSWFAAALDERIRVAIPVAGITDLENHVVDNCVAGHCDCMYPVNLYQWDFQVLAALIAPRPLLIGNTDQDKIFPLDGVVRVHDQVRHIYRLLGAADKLGIQWTTGGHEDTQELQVGCFVWMDRHLQGGRRVITDAATKRFKPTELKVFERLPTDQGVTTVQDWFVQTAKSIPVPSANDWPGIRDRWQQQLVDAVQGRRSVLRELLARDQQKKFIDLKSPSEFTIESKLNRAGVKLVHASTRSQLLPIVRLAIPSGFKANGSIRIVLPDGVRLEKAQRLFVDDAASLTLASLESSVGLAPDPQSAIAVIFQNVTGPADWDAIDETTATHLRRAFLLTGRTPESLQVAGVDTALKNVELFPLESQLHFTAYGPASAVAMHTVVVTDRKIASLELHDLQGPYGKDFVLPGILRQFDMPQVLAMANEKTDTRLVDVPKGLSDWSEQLAKKKLTEPR